MTGQIFVCKETAAEKRLFFFQILCRKALEKAVRNGKTEEKLLKFMIDSGFSYKMINEVRESQSEN